MKVWLISAFEPLPIDNTRPMRFMGIAEALVQNGHDVTFWSSTYDHFRKTQRQVLEKTIRINDQYKLKLVPSRSYKKNISLQRLLAHHYYAKNLLREIEKEDKPDLIYQAFPPISSAYLVSDYAVKNNIPLVIDIIDPWPDAFLNILPAVIKNPSKLLLNNLYAKVRSVFNRCQAVFSISQTYVVWAKKFAAGRELTTGIFYPAVDTSLYNLNEKENEPVNTPVKFIYAGTLGAYYDVETIIDAARHYTGGEAEFIIAGDGPKRKKLEAKARGLPHVKFTGWLSARELNRELVNSDIGLAAYTRKSTQTVTYKLFDYLAAGLPIISSLPGEMQIIIEENGLGFYYKSEDPESFYQCIDKVVGMNPDERREMRSRASGFAHRHGDTKIVYKRLTEKLEEIAELKS